MATAVAIAIVILMLGAAIYFSRLLLQKALRRVVSVFRDQGATDARSARTLEALGLVQAGFLGRIFRPRDYRPQALRLLGQENVIRATAHSGEFGRPVRLNSATWSGSNRPPVPVEFGHRSRRRRIDGF